MTDLTYLTPYAVAESLEAFEKHTAFRISKAKKNCGRNSGTPHPTAGEVLDNWLGRMKVSEDDWEATWAKLARQVMDLAKGNKDHLLPRAAEYKQSLEV